jgi:hypothetical protein
MNDDTIQITGGSGNVFLDLGFDPAEAEVMKLRAEVMIRTAQLLWFNEIGHGDKARSPTPKPST